MRPRTNPYQVRDRETLQRYVDDSKRVVPHSLRSLGKLVGVAPSTIGHLLTGERETVSATVAQRLSAVVGAPIEELFAPVESTSCDSGDVKKGSSE